MIFRLGLDYSSRLLTTKFRVSAMTKADCWVALWGFSACRTPNIRLTNRHQNPMDNWVHLAFEFRPRFQHYFLAFWQQVVCWNRTQNWIWWSSFLNPRAVQNPPTAINFHFCAHKNCRTENGTRNGPKSISSRRQLGRYLAWKQYVTRKLILKTPYRRVLMAPTKRSCWALFYDQKLQNFRIHKTNWNRFQFCEKRHAQSPNFHVESSWVHRLNWLDWNVGGNWTWT